MIARIFRISLVILLLFLTWISTGFLKLVRENGVSFSKFEEYIANADVVGGGVVGAAIGEDGFEDGVAGPAAGEAGAGEAGAGEAGLF